MQDKQDEKDSSLIPLESEDQDCDKHPGRLGVYQLVDWGRPIFMCPDCMQRWLSHL
mgnify:FL=1